MPACVVHSYPNAMTLYNRLLQLVSLRYTTDSNIKINSDNYIIIMKINIDKVNGSYYET